MVCLCCSKGQSLVLKGGGEINSAAVGVNQHNYSLVGKTLASPGNTFDSKS